MAWTDAYATSAIDTCSLDLLRLGDCVTLQEKQGRSCLRTWNMKIIQSKSHHRSAGDCFRDLFLQSACSIYQFRQICSCKNGKVLRCADTVSGHCDITADNRLSQDYCFINRSNGFHVINHASYVCRKHGRIDLSACYRIDQCTLTTLRVFGLEFFYFHAFFAFDGFFHLGNTIRFVVLNTDASHCFRESFQDYF